MSASRLRAPLTVSALVLAGLITASSGAGSAAHDSRSTDIAAAPKPVAAPVALSRSVGLVSETPRAPRHYGTTDPASAEALFASGSLLDNLPMIGSLVGALDIPQVALAAYRNAELRLGQSQPGCGLGWNLLAGIGKVESGHAGGGMTDAAGTSLQPILGPALDGHLPGNEVMRAADGSFVRAVGPMQFLPGTWSRYAVDANGDGIADPNNIYDAALGAGTYLCSGGLNLADPAQALTAVLRYNNSVTYAADVLSWSTAYRTGVDPGRAPAIPVVAPDKNGDRNAKPMTPAPNTIPSVPQTPALPGPAQVEPPMIRIPGLPPIPCGILCPPALPAPPAQAEQNRDKAGPTAPTTATTPDSVAKTPEPRTAADPARIGDRAPQAAPASSYPPIMVSPKA